MVPSTNLFATDKPFRPRQDALYAEVVATLGQPIEKLSNDSRRVAPGVTFTAYLGATTDGRNYIAQAIEGGASAVLWEPRGFQWQADWRVKNMPIENIAQRLAELADAVYGHPSQRLWVIGVTGTNGKTSCSFWLAQALNALGTRTALLGTLGNGFLGELSASSNTTPDAIVLQESLASYVSTGARAVAMEVSSHGLAQRRVDAIAFDFAVFTNLTRDHLDYHATMEEYAAAKARLFDMPELDYAIVNSDDAFGAELARRLAERPLECITYGIESGDVRAQDIRLGADGVSFKVASHWGSFEVWAPVVGRFNIYNLLAVTAVLLAGKTEPAAVTAALAKLTPVPGRMQRVNADKGPSVIIDYAHTPDALEKALQSLREIKRGRLVCVFGCGGNRDRGKRAEMGAIAARLADFSIVTNDNPRDEAPADIIEAITAAMPSDYAVIEDRAEAIHYAIAKSSEADLVLIAGKGHETYQEIAGRRVPFSDAETAGTALQKWTARQ